LLKMTHWKKRVMAVSAELRCLVCQNQTIADSHADLAIDLKNQVREKLRQGMSEQEIVDYMVKRYGDFVLYRPLVKSTTWLLWFGPFACWCWLRPVLFVKFCVSGAGQCSRRRRSARKTGLVGWRCCLNQTRTAAIMTTFLIIAVL